MRLRGTSIFLSLLLSTIFVFGQTENSQASRKCLTDELANHLLQNFPNGVPGKPIPNVEKASEVDVEFTYVIPVIVHVMHNNGIEKNVTLLQAQSQIDVLNEDYGRYGSGFNSSPVGADVKIRFCLASKAPDGSPSTGIDYHLYENAANLDPYTQDTFMKRIAQWDPKRYLNIWTVGRIGNGQIEGYAYFPDEVAGTIWDGFVVRHTSFGRGTGTANTLGRTGTHEVGHYLGLKHPWGNIEGGCYAFSDDCDDTPPVGDAYFSQMPFCNAPLACDGSVRMIENYMDYSADGCMNTFTNCQRDRMHMSLVKYRSELVTANSLLLAGCLSEIDSTVSLGKIYVYPNPADRFLMINVDVESPGVTTIEMVDVAGRKVYYKAEALTGRGIVNIDLAEFAAGSYHLMVRNDKQYLHQTVIVAR